MARIQMRGRRWSDAVISRSVFFFESTVSNSTDKRDSSLSSGLHFSDWIATILLFTKYWFNSVGVSFHSNCSCQILIFCTGRLSPWQESFSAVSTSRLLFFFLAFFLEENCKYSSWWVFTQTGTNRCASTSIVNGKMRERERQDLISVEISSSENAVNP